VEKTEREAKLVQSSLCVGSRVISKANIDIFEWSVLEGIGRQCDYTLVSVGNTLSGRRRHTGGRATYVLNLE
jgi:hypothetical protein